MGEVVETGESSVRSSGGLTRNSFEVGQNQFREVAAVTAFKDAEEGQVQLPQGFADPVEVLGFQRFLRQRITGIAIKPG